MIIWLYDKSFILATISHFLLSSTFPYSLILFQMLSSLWPFSWNNYSLSLLTWIRQIQPFVLATAVSQCTLCGWDFFLSDEQVFVSLSFFSDLYSEIWKLLIYAFTLKCHQKDISERSIFLIQLHNLYMFII